MSKVYLKGPAGQVIACPRLVNAADLKPGWAVAPEAKKAPPAPRPAAPAAS